MAMTKGTYPNIVNYLKEEFAVLFGMYEEADIEEQYTKMFEAMSSDRNAEKYQGLVPFGDVPEVSDHEDTQFVDTHEGYETNLVNLSYAKGFILSRELLDDQDIGLSMKLMKALLRSAKNTKNGLGANVYNRATNTAYTLADGLPLLSTAHITSGTGETFTNRLTNFADLHQTSIEDLILLMGDAVDDAGNRIVINPKTLLVPFKQSFYAEKILGTSKEYDTANNTMSPVGSRPVIPNGFEVCRFLTDDDRWFITTDIDGMIYQNRKEPELIMDYNNRKRKAMEVSVYFRCKFGCYDPRSVYGG